MPDAYTLSFDSDRNRIDFAMAGHWTADDAASWAEAFVDVVDQAEPGFVVVGDMLGSVLQTPEVQATHEQLMAYSVEQGMRRGVLVVGTTTLKLQLERLASNAHSDERILFVGSHSQAEQAIKQVTSR
ncbi:MAG: hypothetical protein R2710_06110 [Acidimicrobiales bacterium]